MSLISKDCNPVIQQQFIIHLWSGESKFYKAIMCIAAEMML